MPFLGVAGIGGLLAFLKPGSKPTVFGGNLSEDSTYYYRTFLGSGTLTVSNGVLAADILLVSGGGGGGPGYGSGRGGGGGGAGGMKTVAGSLTGALSVLVGAGGPGNPAATGSADGASPSGGTSSINGSSTTGGGGGANGAGSAGGNGGSGGGNGGYSALAGTGIAGEGNAGFQSAGTSSRVGAGGGGKGAAANGQAGGAGATSTISGTSNTYAVGGDGGSASGVETGSSAASGSGNGGFGGGGNNSVGVWGGSGGNGGSGVVVVRYLKTAVKESTSAYELIGTITLSTTQSSVTFAGLPSSQYKHLQLRINSRGDTAANYVDTSIRFNGDAGANYSAHELDGTGASAVAFSGASQTYAGLGYSAAANVGTNIYGSIVADILDFSSTSKNKTIRGLYGVQGAGNLVGLRSGAWYSIAAVTSLTVLPSSGNFVAGSRFSLYGIRG